MCLSDLLAKLEMRDFFFLPPCRIDGSLRYGNALKEPRKKEE